MADRSMTCRVCADPGELRRVRSVAPEALWINRTIDELFNSRQRCHSRVRLNSDSQARDAAVSQTLSAITPRSGSRRCRQSRVPFDRIDGTARRARGTVTRCGARALKFNLQKK